MQRRQAIESTTASSLELDPDNPRSRAEARAVAQLLAQEAVSSKWPRVTHLDVAIELRALRTRSSTSARGDGADPGRTPRSTRPRCHSKKA